MLFLLSFLLFKNPLPEKHGGCLQDVSISLIAWEAKLGDSGGICFPQLRLGQREQARHACDSSLSGAPACERRQRARVAHRPRSAFAPARSAFWPRLVKQAPPPKKKTKKRPLRLQEEAGRSKVFLFRVCKIAFCWLLSRLRGRARLQIPHAKPNKKQDTCLKLEGMLFCRVLDMLGSAYLPCRGSRAFWIPASSARQHSGTRRPHSWHNISQGQVRHGRNCRDPGRIDLKAGKQDFGWSRGPTQTGR